MVAFLEHMQGAGSTQHSLRVTHPSGGSQEDTFPLERGGW